MSLSLKDDARARERWSTHWYPRVVLYVKQLYADRSLDAVMTQYELIHARAVEACLAAKLPWKTILKFALDDPMVADLARGGKIAAAVERQRARAHTVQRAVQRRADHVSVR